MINILIVCGIKGFDKYHDSFIKIINNINKPIEITKESCEFYTLQNMNRFDDESSQADLYISDIQDNFFIFDRSFEEAIFEYDQNEDCKQIKKFNSDHNNKFDYIILEHCPIVNSISMIPQFIKHCNMLKNNGYFILFTEVNLDSDFQFTSSINLAILEKLFTKFGNNIYQKTNDILYDMRAQCENYIKYNLNYDPVSNYDELFKNKYLKYKNKYLNIKKIK